MPDGTFELIVAALAKAKVRGVLCGRFANARVDSLPSGVDVCARNSLPLILPHCRAAVLCGEPQDVAAALVVGCPVPVSYTHLTLPTICSV